MNWKSLGENDTFDYDPVIISNHIYANDLDVFVRYFVRTSTNTTLTESTWYWHLLNQAWTCCHPRTEEIPPSICASIGGNGFIPSNSIRRKAGRHPGLHPGTPSQFFCQRKHWIVIAAIVTLWVGLILYILYWRINPLLLIFLLYSITVSINYS